jgi:hypothetical protein
MPGIYILAQSSYNDDASTRLNLRAIASITHTSAHALDIISNTDLHIDSLQIIAITRIMPTIQICP